MRVTNLVTVAALATLMVSCADTLTVNPTKATPLATAGAAREQLPDLDGTPDLIVDGKKLGMSWEIADEVFAAGGCEAIEGEITPGAHRTVRFTVATPNIGDADVYVGDPNEHFDPNGDGDPSDGDGLFEMAVCHGHYHFRRYATYEMFPVLADGSLGSPVAAAKRGFCMLDSKPSGGGYGPSGKAFYRECGAPPHRGLPAIRGNQGISTGWSDIYSNNLPGQFFVLDGFAPGEYLIRITVNPPFVPEAGEACPHTDSSGFCHMFKELSYSNNVAETRFTIPVPRND